MSPLSTSTRARSAAGPSALIACSIIAVMVSLLPVPLSAVKTSVLRRPLLNVRVIIEPWIGRPPMALTRSLCSVRSVFLKKPT
jgi:hypothetical protein